MIIKILDYAGNERQVDVGDIETIRRMFIAVLSGDEVLHVLYKDGKRILFDSSEERRVSELDSIYDVYDIDTGLNMFENDWYIERTSSYERTGPIYIWDWCFNQPEE